MSIHIGSSTIYRTILPNNQALSRIRSVSLSKEAKHRLKIIEYYLSTNNVSLICRHYGICRSYFYKWFNRFNPKYLASLEDLSRRPKHVRQATYNHELIRTVRKLRTDYPRYSANKLAVILKRDFNICYSAATIGRIIKKFCLYFSAVIRAAKKRSKRAVKAWIKRKPYNLKANGPHKVIEFDMKHIWSGGSTQYAFVPPV